MGTHSTFLTRRALSRRTILRGMGVTLALPLLDAMVPALTPTRLSAATPQRRLGCVYIPHGAIMDRWTPATAGPGFDLSPILAPMAPFKAQMTVVTNLARPEKGYDTNHAGAPSSWLAGVPPKQTDGPDFQLATTLDQVVASAIGQDTTFPSIEIATEDFAGLIGDCSPGFSCTYMNTLSWQTPTTPLPMEINPRVVFERMFGGGDTHEARLERMRTDRSLLDFVVADLKTLDAGIGPRDRERLDAYVTHVREIERRITRAERQAGTLPDVPVAPVGVPEKFDDHVGLLFDLMALAYQADLTRVFSFMLGRELSQRTYPQVGVTEPHHTISHHGNRPAAIEMHATVNTYHLTLFAKFLERLANTPDGDGSLLDHALLFYGSGMGNGNVHAADHLPSLLVGGAAGALRGDRHIVAPEMTPNGNLLAAIADLFGAPPDAMVGAEGRVSLS